MLERRPIWLPGQVGLSLLILACALVALHAANLASRFISMLPACPLYAHVGVPCPGCGATRSVMALARGEVLLAFEFNPLVALATWGVLSGAVVMLLAGLAGRRVPTRLADRHHVILRWGIIALLSLNWLYVLLRQGMR